MKKPGKWMKIHHLWDRFGSFDHPDVPKVSQNWSRNELLFGKDLDRQHVGGDGHAEVQTSAEEEEKWSFEPPK